MEINYPPYKITDKMLNLATNIMEKIGEANYFESLNRFPELRRKTRIKSIHSSLAIENNQLSLFQVEAVINGKAVSEVTTTLNLFFFISLRVATKSSVSITFTLNIAPMVDLTTFGL